MKKTPADFIATPAYNALQAVVAVTALAGVASNMIPKANASTKEEFTYNTATQKAQLGSMTNLFTSTSGNIQTSSRTYSGQYAPSTDDSNYYTDNDN